MTKYCNCFECEAYYSGKGGKGCQYRGTNHKIDCYCRYCKKFGNLERNKLEYNKRVAETLELAKVARQSLDAEAKAIDNVIRVDFVARKRMAS